MHECKLIHRNLKSSNIFLNKGKIKIGDFGMASFLSQLSKQPILCFSEMPAFEAPELLAAAVNGTMLN